MRSSSGPRCAIARVIRSNRSCGKSRRPLRSNAPTIPHMQTAPSSGHTVHASRNDHIVILGPKVEKTKSKLRITATHRFAPQLTTHRRFHVPVLVRTKVKQSGRRKRKVSGGRSYRSYLESPTGVLALRAQDLERIWQRIRGDLRVSQANNNAIYRWTSSIR